jgi:hypothetical protein
MKLLAQLFLLDKGGHIGTIIGCLIFGLALSSFLNVDEAINKDRNRANTNMEIDQSDTSKLADRFIDKDKDAYGVNNEAPELSYNNLTAENTTPEQQFDIKAYEEQTNQIKAEQEELFAPKPPKQTRRNISADELISSNEYENDVPNPKRTNKSEPSKETERVGFNTTTLNSKYNNTSSSANKTSESKNNYVLKARAYSSTTQTLMAGSKAKFHLKDDIGSLKKGDVIYGRVTYQNGAFQIIFSANQLGTDMDLYLFSDNEKGIIVETMTSEMKNETIRESKRQGASLGGDIVREIPIVGGMASKIIYRIGEGGRQQAPQIELVRGETFNIQNDF